MVRPFDLVTWVPFQCSFYCLAPIDVNEFQPCPESIFPVDNFSSNTPPWQYFESVSILGMIDSSGLRFHYTKQLRKYDAGTLTVGAFVSRTAMVIPPRQTDWEINGFCSAECTRVVCTASACNKISACILW